MGYHFTVMASNFDEKSIRHGHPAKLTVRLAKAKAKELLPKIKKESILITSDQVVLWKKEIREKPANQKELEYFLSTAHQSPAITYASVYVINTKSKKFAVGVDVAGIHFKKIPANVIKKLLKKKYLYTMAGGFTIENPLIKKYIKKIIAEHESIIGLPQNLTHKLIKKLAYPNTLLLTSSGAPIAGFLRQIFNKDLQKIKIGWITTAKKGVTDWGYLRRHKARMKKLKMDYEEIDIDGKSGQKLYQMLKEKDAIHVEGGNPFYLLKSARKSGLKEVINKLLNDGVIYIGSSAGTYITCPTIEMSYWSDRVRPDYGIKNLAGMNLIPFVIKAHYKPGDKIKYQNKIKKLKYLAKFINDSQAILVKNRKWKILNVRHHSN